MSFDQLFNPTGTPTQSTKGFGSLFSNLNEEELARKRRLAELESRQQLAQQESKYANSLLGTAANTFIDLGTKALKIPTDFLQNTYAVYQQTPEKIASGISEGAKDIQAGKPIKGIIKAGGRTAGDALIAVYAPLGGAISAILNATGGQRLVDDAGKVIADSRGITDIPAFQQFALAHPNAGEDFNRLLNLAFAAAEKGTINPSRLANEVATVADKLAGSPVAKVTGARAASETRFPSVKDESGGEKVGVTRNERRIPVKGTSEEVSVPFANRYTPASELPTIQAGRIPRVDLPTIQIGARETKGPYTYEPVKGGFDDVFTSSATGPELVPTSRTTRFQTVQSGEPVTVPAQRNQSAGTEIVSETAPNTRAKTLQIAAIEKKLTDSLGELPTHNKMNMREQAVSAETFVETNPDGAIRVAKGEAFPPQGILAESVYTALEIKAIKSGDVALIQELANSKVPTIAGQSLKALDSVDPNSPVKIIRDIQTARETKVEKQGGAKAIKLKEQEIARIDKEIVNAQSRRPQWEEFIREITCGY